ncbi:MAG: sigma-70 family RNA polymerase sigma factor [Clostridia bacterium]|nr:sigma-70 family RNA polymerase sigma factor [Clostridia bacterium]
MDENDLRWARYWARRYAWAVEGRGDMDLEDLTQAALLGILRAREGFDAQESSWSTYSAFYIKREIFAALGIRRGRLPMRPVPLDAPMTLDSDETKLDAVADDSLPDADEGLLRRELQDEVRRALARLKDERQRRSVQLVSLEGMTLRQAARKMGVSFQLVQRMVLQGHRHLRCDKLLRKLAECELRTPYYAHVGVDTFMATRTSAVERAVLWRLEQQDRILDELGEDETEDGQRNLRRPANAIWPARRRGTLDTNTQ